MENDKRSFAGQYGIITGGTQGLGEATARLFAERDIAGLIICGRNAERGQAVASDLTASGCPTHFVQMDLTNVADCQRAVAQAEAHFGTVHVVVNAAASTARGTIWDTEPDLWDHMMAVNVRAPFLLMQESAKLMRRDKIAGSIVNVTSVAAYGGPAFLTPYSTSKGALVILTKKCGICLNAVSDSRECVELGMDGYTG